MICCCIRAFSFLSSVSCLCICSFSLRCCAIWFWRCSKLVTMRGLTTLMFSSLRVCKLLSIIAMSYRRHSISFLYSRNTEVDVKRLSSIDLMCSLTFPSVDAPPFSPLSGDCYYNLNYMVKNDLQSSCGLTLLFLLNLYLFYNKSLISLSYGSSAS